MPKPLHFIITSSLLCLLIAIGCGDDADERIDAEALAGDDAPIVNGLTPEQAAQPLVEIGEETITTGEFAALLADQSPYLRSRYNSPERRREFLENQIRFELLALEAERRGLTDLPEVQRSRKQIMIQRMMKERIYDPNSAANISEVDIRAYYDEHVGEFRQPAQVRASHILIANRSEAQRTLRQILAAEDDIAIFRRLAEQNNEDSQTRDRLGDLRFFFAPGDGGPTSAVPPEVARAAFSIERIGGVHPELVQSSAGYHIIKLTGRRAALRRSVEEASRPIRNTLMRQRREEAMNSLVDGLRAAAAIEENLEVLDQIRLDIPEGASPTTERLRPEPAPPGAP